MQFPGSDLVPLFQERGVVNELKSLYRFVIPPRISIIQPSRAILSDLGMLFVFLVSNRRFIRPLSTKPHVEGGNIAGPSGNILSLVSSFKST